ncbi:MAG: hypothetical protein GF370_00255 [Candidatus Nealsonbacteria bacterium]|nr:hypothetical protein [Candidatus Nealsonbacteria bacterium]
MKNKVRDIVPPGNQPSSEKNEEPLPDFEPEKKSKKGFWLILPVLLVAVFFGGIYLSEAEVQIVPSMEKVSFRDRVQVSTDTQETDSTEGVLPGKFFEAITDYSQAFSATGKITKKAEGVIRLYNAYTTDSETWLAGTRFISDEGKMFKSKDKINVPGAEIKGGDLIPRYVDVPVVAAEPGEEYNIGPAHFSIFVYRGTPKYTKFYGESLQAMTGGGETTQVTQEDVSKAEEQVEEEAREKSIQRLRERLSGNYFFLPDAVELEVTDVSCLAAAGDEVEKFNCKAEIRGVTIGVEEQELRDYGRGFILSEIPEQKEINNETIEVDYSSHAVDVEGGEVVLSLDLSADIFSRLDTESLKQRISGKSKEDAKFLLENQFEIQESKIKISPFWASKIPSDVAKIEIDYPVFGNL